MNMARRRKRRYLALRRTFAIRVAGRFERWTGDGLTPLGFRIMRDAGRNA